MKQLDYRFKKKAAPYLFISPFYILFLIFSAFPIFYSLYLSFNIWDGLSPMEFVGFENYTYVLTDSWFWKSVYNTLVLFFISAIPQHAIALVLAFILNSNLIRLKEFFRSSYFLPYITSSIAIGTIFAVLYGENAGVLNEILKYLASFPPIKAFINMINLDVPIRWLGKSFWIKPSIALMVIWQWTGYQMIIYYAGIKSIPKSLYEAARVDGASIWQIFFKITLPMLKNVILFAFTMSIIGSLQMFNEPYILTDGSGGTSQAGMTTALYLYRTGFIWTQFGVGSAMAYILCILIIVITALNYKLFQREW